MNEKKENLKKLWSVLDQKEWPTEEEIVDLLREYDILEEVIQLAFDGWVENVADGVCELTKSGELESHCYTGGSYNRDSNIGLYRFDANWVSNGCWDKHDMLVSDEEWELLQEKFGEEADFTDEKQLASIGIDRSERLVEQVLFCLE
ncbi:MAG TPA: hypothetical protein PLD55_04335 [bacterium]|nr:hypothetical protein [bacterium]